MKILGLLSIAVVVVIGYCVYNPSVDAADLTSTETKTSLSAGCKGPFGFDSQKVLSGDKIFSWDTEKYIIGIVSSVNLSKNADGTWYVSTCKLAGDSRSAISFAAPYPQQNDLKVGDFIGFSASDSEIGMLGRPALAVEVIGSTIWYNSGKILDYISRQSVDCRIENMSQLSTPYTEHNRPPFDREGHNVTGVIMAVDISRNRDPEPDNPDDYQISSAVMKCADSNLYIVYLSDLKAGVNLPRYDAFGEGDVVTVKQTSPVRGPRPRMDNTPSFSAYWDNSSIPEVNTKTAATDNTKGNIGTSMMSYPVENFADDQSYKVLSVVDANTVEIDYKGKKIKFDLIGVGVLDSSTMSRPDRIRADAVKAYTFTKHLLLSESVYLRFDSQQNYNLGKRSAYVYRAPDGLFVNLELIRQGYAVIYPGYSQFRYQRLFRYYEDKAREARKGIHTIPLPLLKQYRRK